MKLGASLFYVFITVFALILARVFHLNPWQVPPLMPNFPVIATVSTGLGLGVLLVIASHILDRFPRFARLNTLIARHLPHLAFGDIVFLSLLSSFSEELLFRGVLFPLIGIHLSSLVFGLLHYGGRRDFILWGLMGWVMGYILAGVYLLTGSLLTPILTHLTVNYFNLLHLMKTRKTPEEGAIPPQGA